MFKPHDVTLLTAFWEWLKTEDHLTDEVQLGSSAQMDIEGFFDDQSGNRRYESAQRLSMLKEIHAYEDAGREVEKFVDGSGRLVGYHVVPVQHQLEEGESVTTSLITD